MYTSFYRRLLFGCLIVALVVGYLVLQHPSQSSESAVVFSNMPGSNSSGEFIVAGQDVAVVFDVPAGANYQINSLQTPIENSSGAITQTITARIHADNTGAVGSVVVDLGSQDLPPLVTTTLTFTPVGSATLLNGGRYWLVLSNPGTGTQWWSADPPITPTGIFTFVDNGVIVGGAFFSQALRFNLTLDADPMSGSAGGGSGCANSDGRLNSVCAEPWQTAAIYCRADGSIDVYGITDSEGWLAFRTTQAEIDAVGLPNQNALLERSDDGKIRLYRLATGEFQVNAPRWDNVRGNLPDGYVFIFGGCS